MTYGDCVSLATDEVTDQFYVGTCFQCCQKWFHTEDGYDGCAKQCVIALLQWGYVKGRDLLPDKTPRQSEEELRKQMEEIEREVQEIEREIERERDGESTEGQAAD
jgi:hypothetical protein